MFITRRGRVCASTEQMPPPKTESHSTLKPVHLPLSFTFVTSSPVCIFVRACCRSRNVHGVNREERSIFRRSRVSLREINRINGWLNSEFKNTLLCCLKEGSRYKPSPQLQSVAGYRINVILLLLLLLHYIIIVYQMYKVI